MAVVYREIWIDQVEKAFNEALKDTFLDGIVDVSRYVQRGEESQTIHSTFFGVMPDVLINNTTYPIPLQELDGEDRTITLDKYQTKVTPVTDDELYALAYDKMKLVKDAHVEALVTNRLKKAIHALAPAEDGEKTPVILTTGEATADGSRKRMRWADVITYRERLSNAGIPIDGVRLVLCQDHVNDLLLEDQDLFKTYANRRDGSVSSQLGLDIREYAANPYYDVNTKKKLSFGGVVGNEHRRASVAFMPKRARKAQGDTRMYWAESRTNPEYQRNLIAFRNYFIVMPTSMENIGAIVSAKAS